MPAKLSPKNDERERITFCLFPGVWSGAKFVLRSRNSFSGFMKVMTVGVIKTTGHQMNEAEIVYWALQQFTFAVKFAACCFNRTISFSVFKAKTIVNIQNDIKFEIPEWDTINQVELNKAAMNQLMISLGASTIAVDEALFKRHGKSSFPIASDILNKKH